MVYKDYLNAARKHNSTCLVILNKIDEIEKNKKFDKGLHTSLLLNLYYLSGYIIECIVKYGIYFYIGYSKDADIKQLNQDRLNYKEHIKHHKFEKYTEYLNSRISGTIPLLNDIKSPEKEVVELYKQWDADIRYSYNLKKDPSHYKKFYEYACNIRQKIINICPY